MGGNATTAAGVHERHAAETEGTHARNACGTEGMGPTQTWNGAGVLDVSEDIVTYRSFPHRAKHEFNMDPNMS